MSRRPHHFKIDWTTSSFAMCHLCVWVWSQYIRDLGTVGLSLVATTMVLSEHQGVLRSPRGLHP